MHILNFDKEYLKWARILVASHSMTTPDEKMYLSVVNLSDSDIEELHLLHENLIIENELVNPEDVPLVAERITRPDLPDKYGSVGNRMPEFMACRIPSVFLSAFKKFVNEDIFILTGADMFINKAFPFKEYIKAYDSGLLIGNTGSPPSNLATGVMALKNISACRRLVDMWVDLSYKAKEIRGYKKDHWFWDQVTLNVVAEEMAGKKEITIKKLPHEKLINTEQSDEAYMWSVHKHSKTEREIILKSWAKELEKRRAYV